MARKDGPADPKSEVKYRKKWAVVVGINYNREDRKALNRGEIDRLDRAESDAKEFADAIIKYYGYRKDEVVLLTGKDATKEAIEGYLRNGFLCDPNRVSPEDSVLFYFSGHGYLARDRAVGYLIPFDVRKTDSGAPDFATAINTSDVLVNNLRADCPARHKLLILDCCHSGSVFRIADAIGGGRSPDEAIDRELFRAAAFQAITASREGQLASDGDARSDHSPFTKALLHALYTIPQRRLDGRPSFTNSELFHEMQMMLRGALPDEQSPQSWWLDGNRGEFHFFPDPGAEFPRDELKLTEEEKRIFLAIVPSAFGNWWADEFPWFMPSLRYEILQEFPKTKSSDSCPDIRELRKVAERLAKPGGKSPDYRHEHLALLLKTEGIAGRAEVFRRIIDRLEKEVEDPKSPNRPLDLHYLGVLLQKCGKASDSRRRYQEALEAYEALGKGRENLRALQALCQVDFGVLCLTGLFDFDCAVESFQKARHLVEMTKAPPGPFVAYTYCREADAYRRLGRFVLSEHCMYQARLTITRIDPTQSQPMSSAIWKQDALGLLEQCKFKEAADSFEQSRRALEKSLDNGVNRYQCLIDLFHVKHGLALIERFQGRDERSLVAFRRLTAEIAEAIRALDNSPGSISNFAEIRQLLCERYVNSMERQADCGLFGQVPDCAEAADDYRRALRACVYFPEDRRDAVRLDLLYRRAAALSLPSGARDPKLAESLCREADRIERHLSDVQKIAGLPTKVRLVRAIARTLVLACDGHPRDPATDVDDQLWAVLKDFQDSGAGRGPAGPDLQRVNRSRMVDRDELERLMFAYKLLLTNRDRWGLDRFEAMSACDELLILCRRATRNGRLIGGMDPDFLAYLRPYHDEAFRYKAAQSPAPVKELMEIAWEATRGTPYLKPAEVNPTLVLYRPAGQSYLLLDVPASRAAPGGLSRCFPLKEEWNDERALGEACRSDRLLPLPAELRQVLASLRTPNRLVIRWRDPVPGVGGLALPPAAPGSLALVPGDTDRSHFPFDLKDVMNGVLYSDREDAGQPAIRSAPVASKPETIGGAESVEASLDGARRDGARHASAETP
jgi:tetratricopeptide (TPR) repeat protein